MENDITAAMYDYWLCCAMNENRPKLSRLLWALGTSENVYRAGYGRLSRVPDVTAADVAWIKKSRDEFDIKAEFERLERLRMSFITLKDKSYPLRLLPLSGKPFSLFFKGELPDEGKRSVAIVGARRCSEYGRSCAHEIAAELAAAGINVISGMAEGIDSAAHRGALCGGGKTYAVCGCGADRCYPSGNISLYADIEKNGGIISEYVPGTPPLPRFFPERNRIISGLADAVIVIEAREKSGSLITADRALEQGRDVFALPGRVCDSLSAGCNRLIREGAALIRGAEDVLAEFHMDETDSFGADKTDSFGADGKAPAGKKRKKPDLENDLAVVYSCLDLSPKPADMIMEETGLSASIASKALVELEMMGLVFEPAKDFFVKCGSGKGVYHGKKSCDSRITRKGEHD